MKYAYEKEIVLYAHYLKLDYFSTECVYSPEAFRGNARSLLKAFERLRPTSILDIVKSGEQITTFFKDDLDETNGGQERTDWKQTDESFFSPSFIPNKHGIVASEKEIIKYSNGDLRKQRFTDKYKNTKERHVHEGQVYLLDHVRSISKQEYVKGRGKAQIIGFCEKCGYMSSQKVCKACMLVDSLNKSKPSISL